MEIIKTHNLTKMYGTHAALKDVSLTLKSGEIYGLIGKNGAGKTTFMRIIAGLTNQTGGGFSLFGKSSPQDLIAARSQIGAIVETPVLYSNMTAYQNVKAMAILKGIHNLDAAIGQSLQFAGLTTTANKKVKNFSLGMKQRLAIAIALLTRPQLLILDEPVNGLDPVGIVEVRNVLQSINREFGVTIMVSSHILTELSHIATNYGIIHNGRLIEEIGAQQLMSKIVTKLNIALVNRDDIEKATKLLTGRFNVEQFSVQGDTLVVEDKSGGSLSAEVNKAFAMEDISIRSISYIQADLESYFINLTRRG